MEALEHHPPASPQGGYYLSSTFLIGGLVVWHALFKLALLGYRRFFPNHHKFLLGYKGDLRVEFFILELMAYPTVFFNIYSCAEAFAETDPALDMVHHRSPLSWAGQKCLGSRIFQYITEIGFEREWTQTFSHHLVSIGVLPPALAFGAPRRQMYITILSLAVEPLGTNLRLFAIYNDWKTHRPRLDYATRVSQFLGWTLVRLPCHLYTLALAVLWSGGSPAERALLGLSHGLLVLYSLGMVGRFSGRFGLWTFRRARPAAWLLARRHPYTFLAFALYAGGALLVLLTPALVRSAGGPGGPDLSPWAGTAVQAGLLVAVPYFLRYFWRSDKDLVENPRQVGLERIHITALALAALEQYATGWKGVMMPSLMINSLLQEALAHLGCYLEELFDDSPAASLEAPPGETLKGETEKAAPLEATPGETCEGETKKAAPSEALSGETCEGETDKAVAPRPALPTHLLACAALSGAYLSTGALVLAGNLTLRQAAGLAAVLRAVIKGAASAARGARLRAERAAASPPPHPPRVERSLVRLASAQAAAGAAFLAGATPSAATAAAPLAVAGTCVLPAVAAVAAGGAALGAARSARVRAGLRFVTAWKSGQALAWLLEFAGAFYYGLIQMEANYADHRRRLAAGLVHPAAAPSDPWAYATPALLVVGLLVLPGLLSH